MSPLASLRLFRASSPLSLNKRGQRMIFFENIRWENEIKYLHCKDLPTKFPQNMNQWITLLEFFPEIFAEPLLLVQNCMKTFPGKRSDNSVFILFSTSCIRCRSFWVDYITRFLLKTMNCSVFLLCRKTRLKFYEFKRWAYTLYTKYTLYKKSIDWISECANGRNSCNNRARILYMCIIL